MFFYNKTIVEKLVFYFNSLVYYITNKLEYKSKYQNFTKIRAPNTITIATYRYKSTYISAI